MHTLNSKHHIGILQSLLGRLLLLAGLSMIFIPAKALSAQDKLEPLERIGIRPGKERAEFVLTQSGQPFFVKGFNYIRLRGGHATFDADTETTKAHYDPKAEPVGL
jgi:hypothetical protein